MVYSSTLKNSLIREFSGQKKKTCIKPRAFDWIKLHPGNELASGLSCNATHLYKKYEKRYINRIG